MLKNLISHHSESLSSESVLLGEYDGCIAIARNDLRLSGYQYAAAGGHLATMRVRVPSRFAMTGSVATAPTCSRAIWLLDKRLEDVGYGIPCFGSSSQSV